jgi:hypothetical protein
MPCACHQYDTSPLRMFQPSSCGVQHRSFGLNYLELR